MDKNSKTIPSIVGGLLVVLIGLAVVMGGTEGKLFTVVFWALAMSLAATLIFAITSRRHPR